MGLRSLFDRGISGINSDDFEPVVETVEETNVAQPKEVKAEEVHAVESADIQPAVKRGRPSKTAPVYDSNGAVLISSEQREQINTLVDEINSCRQKVEKLMLSAAKKHFLLGEILYQVEKKSVGKMTASRYEEMTGVPSRLVHTAMKIYKNFADNPEALENMTMRDVALLIAEKKDAGSVEVAHVKYSLPGNEGDAELVAEQFGLPTVSGVSLNNYRLHSDGKSGHIYLLSRASSAAIPVVNLTVGQPQDKTAELAYNGLMQEMQCALEKYYSVIEQEERQ